MRSTAALFQGTLFLTIAMLFSRGSVVLASALVARAFGAEAFALFTFVHLTATSFSNMAMLGMMNGLPRFCARMAVDHSVDALTQVFLAAGVVAVGLVIAILTVSVLPAEIIGLSDSSRKGVLSALILGIGLNNLLVGVSNGFERFGWVTISSFGLGVILICGTLLAVLLDAPHWPLRIYIVATFISLLILAPGGLKQIVVRYVTQGILLNARNFHAVWSYLGPMFLATVMTNTGLWLAGRSLIGGAGGNTAFAEFALGMQWFGLAQMGSNVISRTIMPRLTRNVWTQDASDQNTTMRQALLFSVLSASIVLVGVILSSPFFLPAYGPGMVDARWALILFVSSAVVAAPISILNSLLIAEGKYITIFLSVTIWWIITVIGSYALKDEPAIFVIGCLGLGYAFQAAFLWLGQRLKVAI